jgi:fibronectin type 3 domain-containing protein
VSVDGAGRLSRRSTLWAVRAVNPTPPSAPANLEAFSREDGIALDWQAPPEEDVGSYRIYVSREQSAPIEEFRYLDSTVQTSYHEPMEQGNLAEIRFYVRAVNTSNVEGPPSEVVSARLLDVTPPAAPYLRDVSVGERRLSVTWSATSNPDVASYRLYRAREDGDFRLIQGAIAANVTRYQDDDVEPGVLYRYALEAVDASGNVSERSNVLSGRAYDLSVPQAVTGLSATLTDDGVRLAWDAQSGLRYVVERARGADGAFFEISDLLDGASFVDAGGQPGDRYRVFAVGDSGRSGPPSPSVEVRE